MDRSRHWATGRMLIGLVVLAAALWAGLAGSGPLDGHAGADPPSSSARHAVLHERGAALRTVFPLRDNRRAAKASLREAFAVLVGGLGVALLLAGCRPKYRTTTRHPSFVRFGAPRAPPRVQLPA